MTQQRDTTYDIMKGVGILMVLIGHIWQLNDTVFSLIIYSFHMPLFFIVAGCFSKTYDESKGRIGKIIASYFKRLYLPVLAMTLLLVLWYIVKTLNNTKFANRIVTTLLSPIWASTIPLPTSFGNVVIGALWFLMALLCAKVIFLFLSKWNYWGGFISLLLSVCAFLISAYKPLVPWCLLQGLIALPFLFIGQYWHKKLIPEWTGILLVPIWICVILFSHIDMYSFVFERFPMDILGAVGGTWVFYELSKLIANYTHHVANVLAFLGICSLSIYCWHAFDVTGNVFHQIFCWIGVPENVVLDYILRYTLTVAVGIASVKLPILKKVFA